MRYPKFLLAIVLILPFLNSCKIDFSVNADWKDITIVYGLISQSDSIHYLKITKAFLGQGNALTYAKISDSSNYRPGDLNVRIDVLDENNQNIGSLPFSPDTIHTKEPGDSIFYFPDQLVYKSNATLKQTYTYNLVIHNNLTGNEVTAKTALVNTFSIITPDEFTRPAFMPGENSSVEWTSAKGGKRYQLVIRFHYTENPINHPDSVKSKSIDWLVFSNELSRSATGGEDMIKTISGNAFYFLLAARIPVNPDLKRTAGKLDYIFSVASDDLNTYMEVTEPSTSIVQYRPPFTNIINGIGLFSSRFVNPVIGLRLSDNTLQELRDNPQTADLGF